MVAYSFKARFVEPIKAGTKRQTIRAERKRHARPGDRVHLYTAMRTRQCRLIGTSLCFEATPIRLGWALDDPFIELRGGVFRDASDRDVFAVQDGFANWEDMRQFWAAAHPDLVVFSGVLIRWGDLL